MRTLCYVSRIKNVYGFFLNYRYFSENTHVVNFNGANLNHGSYAVRYLFTKFRFTSSLIPHLDKIVAYD